MSPSPLPLITEHDYPWFQWKIPELQHTSYDEWLDDHVKAIAYRRNRNGFVEVPILPAEFERWLETSQQTVHLELLWAFAEDLATGSADTVIPKQH